MKIFKLVSALCIIGSIAAPAAQAQELTGTLKKIKESGAITLGARESAAPFSYALEGNVFTGYSYEIMLKVVDRIKSELKLPQLKVSVIPFAAQNRIPLMVNGTLDFECTSTTNNLERQQQVAFSNSIFVIGSRLIVAKDSGIKDFEELKGKTVATTSGTTSERLLNKVNETKGLGLNVIAVRENGQAFLAVESGRAAAFMMDDAILYGERAKSKSPEKWTVVGTPQSREAYGCMMRKDDAPFKKLVDSALADMMKSGEMTKLYHKWFEQPIPPRQNTLAFPMSDDVRQLYASPNDKAL
ncbi:MAG: glutamate/aspartate ABC transporter substrate-binding protein [Herminiimonas sp.]|nr:glutamate/aspartate ABC transporter substrate-binding protein [Herminiimonas sp.]